MVVRLAQLNASPVRLFLKANVRARSELAVSALIGNLWALITPWRALFAAAEWLWRQGDRGELSVRLAYPKPLGVWPAVVLLFVFCWIELVYPNAAVPAHLAILTIAYSGWTWTGMVVFGGRTWLRHGEVFSVVFSLFARFAPTDMRRACVCPAGKLLTTTGRIHDGRTILYRASTRDCGPCPLKPKCCPKLSWRKVPRDVNEEARDQARALMGTPEFEKSRDERKRVEMRFAHLKTHHRFERMRLRGLSGARDEFHLAAIVQNLKTLANCLWRPPPTAPATYLA